LFDEEAVMKHIDQSTLEMALVGYEAERQKIEAAIAAIRKQVDGHAAAPAVDGAHRPKRNMSAAARRSIAAAQRKRWAAFHAEKKAGNAPKRKMSAAAKAKLAANLAKARAAKAAKTKRMAAAA
jgi:hypothetical protein